nr:hypothetical protein BaRGS_010751 [Batillaria attramentaria]
MTSNVTESAFSTTDEIGRQHDLGSSTVDLEKTVFIACISLVSLLAIPPNLVLIVLAITSLGARKKSKNGAKAMDRDGESTCLFVSKCVSHLIMCLTSPMDGMFIQQEGADLAVCLAFLGTKSTLILYSVLAVALLGLDKLQRVYYIQKPFARSRLKVKLAAIFVTACVSVLPVVLHLCLADGNVLARGCNVLPVVVDVAETIFLGGVVIIIASLVGVVILLRKHGRRVSVKSDFDDADYIGNGAGPGKKRLASLGRPSTSDVQGALETATDVSETSFMDRSPSDQPVCFISRAARKKTDDADTRAPPASATREKATCSQETRLQHRVLNSTRRTEAVSVEQANQRMSTTSSVFLVEEEFHYRSSNTSTWEMDRLQPVPCSSSSASNSGGQRKMRRLNSRDRNQSGNSLTVDTPTKKRVRVELNDARAPLEVLQSVDEGCSDSMSKASAGVGSLQENGSEQKQVWLQVSQAQTDGNKKRV